MATSEELKRKSMDAVSHRETAIHRRSFAKGKVRPPTSALPSRGQVLDDVKRQAMNAISNVETVTQIGMLKVAGGVVAYVGRIREADREAQMHKAHGPRVVQVGKEQLER